MDKSNDCCQHFTVRRFAGTYNGVPIYESWCEACGRSAVPEGKMIVLGAKAEAAAEKILSDIRAAKVKP